jgi:hypothetical protein
MPKHSRCLTLLVAILVAGWSLPAVAQGGALTPDIAQAVGLTMRGGQAIDSCGGRVTPRIQRVDLNGDGTEEVFVVIPGTCEGGRAGAYLTLLVRAPGGGWSNNLGFPAGGYRILPRRRGGYPDIEIEMPGSCAPVWGWNGQRYHLVRRCP